MKDKIGQSSIEKNEMFMRSIEGELEQFHGTLHNTNAQIIKTNQELRMVKWSMNVVVILLALIAVKLGAFKLLR